MQHASFQIEHESDRPLAMFAALILSKVRDSVLVQKPRSYAVSSVQPAGVVVQLQSGKGVNFVSEQTVCSARAVIVESGTSYRITALPEPIPLSVRGGVAAHHRFPWA